MPRIVAVVGATGTQGKGVVDALLVDGTFTPRALTRNSSSEAAKTLEAKGAQVVQVDPTSTESLTKALEGSEAVFLVTAVMVPQPELDQAQRVVEASKKAGIKFLVFTSLPRMVKVTPGQPDKVVYDHKTQVEEYIKSSGLPHSILYLGYFLENAWKHGYLKADPSNPAQANYSIPRFTGDHRHVETFVWAERDVGEAFLTLLKNYSSRSEITEGAKFYVPRERLTLGQQVDIISKVIGKPVNFVRLETSGHALRDEVYDVHRESGSYVGVSAPDPRLVELGARFGTVQEWAEANKEKLLAAVA